MLARPSRAALLLAAPALFFLDCTTEPGTGDTSHPLPITTSAGSGIGGASTSSGTGGATTSSMMTTTTSSGSSGSGGACSTMEPTIETPGSKTKVLLKGTILTPTGPIDGQVLISGNSIACVAADCSAQASGATVVDTHGVVSPGLIDAHDHILFDIFDEDDWSPPQNYTNHNQWPNDARYGAMVDTKQYLDGETSSEDFACEMDKYGEMKELIAGTTSIQGSPGTSRTCYGSVARTIDTSANDLPDDKMQTATIFPSMSSADGVCANFSNGKTNAYVVHVAEGVDTSAHNEFGNLFTISSVDGCLYDPKTAIVHGTALNDADFTQMGAHQMSLVWSPRSNVFLYGAGTDLTKTTDVKTALSHGINVAVATDWSIGGSQNMLDEMRYADVVDNGRFGDILTSQDIWKMATVNAAHALGVSSYLGTLEVGKRADIAVFSGDTSAPYDAILAATPHDVAMVFVDGRLLYGDGSVEGLGPDNATCEPLDVCGCAKVACIAETGGTGTDKFGQTFADIKSALDGAITDYDALNITQFKFAPIAPLVKCQ